LDIFHHLGIFVPHCFKHLVFFSFSLKPSQNTWHATLEDNSSPYFFTYINLQEFRRYCPITVQIIQLLWVLCRHVLCMKLDFVSKAINMLYWAICHGWTPLSLNHWGEKDDYFDSLESAATSIKNILSDLVIKNNWGCVWGRIKIYLVMKLLFLFVSCNFLLQS